MSIVRPPSDTSLYWNIINSSILAHSYSFIPFYPNLSIYHHPFLTMHPHQSQPRPPPTHSMQSSHIVARILEDIILLNVATNCVPKYSIYKDSILKAALIEDSITTIAHAEPDCSHARIHQNQDIMRSPTFFKVKQQTILSKVQSPYKKLAKPRISRQSIQSVDQKIPRVQSEADAELQMGFSAHLLKKRSSREQSRSNHRFFPSVSAHCESGNLDKPNQMARPSKQHQCKDTEDDIIKILRQNKLLLNTQSKYKHSSEKQDSIKKQNLLKKFKDTFKQAQPKKFMALTTNYDGIWIAIGKADANRQILHYIDVQAQVVQENERLNYVNSSDAREIELDHEFTNYKELKYCERESKFAASLYRNFWNRNAQDVYQSDENKNKSHTNLQQKQLKKPAELFKLTGKTYKPTKVGFNTFEKMKKSNWKVQKSRKDQKDQSNEPPGHQTGVGLKFSTRKKIEAKQSKSSSLRQSKIQKQMNKKQNVTLGNTQAVNFLLYGGDRKYLKKSVKINSQFL